MLPLAHGYSAHMHFDSKDDLTLFLSGSYMSNLFVLGELERANTSMHVHACMLHVFVECFTWTNRLKFLSVFGLF